MPIILETIDAIARRIGRDVIFLVIVERQDRPSRDRPEVAEATDQQGIETLASRMEVNEIDSAAFQEAARPLWSEIAATAGQEFADRFIAAAQGN
jgi:TRAP-type C4-dicarboxylate transport system substrate-binding protein